MPKTRSLACEHGADAIVVSNHGGRQLDGARSTISALPEVVERRRRALRRALRWRRAHRTGRAQGAGARRQGMSHGQSLLYALAARGEAGVTLALDIIRKELAVSLALTGANDVRNVTRDILVPRG